MATITLVQPFNIDPNHFSNQLVAVNANSSNQLVTGYTVNQVISHTNLKVVVGETFSANSTNREFVVTFPAGTIVNGNNNNVVTVGVGRTDAAVVSTEITFQFKCNLCDGDDFLVTVESYENGSLIGTADLLAPSGNPYTVWSPNMLRGVFGVYSQSGTTQTLNSPFSTPAGTTVVYKLFIKQENPCLRNGSTYDVNLTIPSGATLKNVYRQVSAQYNVLEWQHLSSSPNFSFASDASANHIYIEVAYDCNVLGMQPDMSVKIVSQTTSSCGVSSRTLNLVQRSTVEITPSPSTVDTSNMLSVTKTLSNSGPHLVGQTKEYKIKVRNTSDYPVTNIKLEDLLPSGLTGIHFKPSYYHFSSNTCVIEATDATTGNTSQITVLSGNNYIAGASAFSVDCGSAVLLPRMSFQFIIRVTINANVSHGQVLTNQANVSYVPMVMNCSTGTIDNNDGDPESANGDASLTVTNEPIIKVEKTSCKNGCFQPGDTIRFLMLVRNIGTTALPSGTIPTLNDNLPPNLTFVGGSEQYFEIGANYPLKPKKEICFIDDILLPPLSNPSAVTSNNVNGDTSLSWNIDGNELQPSNDPNHKQIVIIFDCLVNNTPLPNNKGINEDITITNIPSDVNTKYDSNAEYDMCVYSELQAHKTVSTDGGATFNTQGVTTAGSTIRYRIKLSNLGTTILSNIRIADDLPHVGDVHLLEDNGVCIARNSQFNVSVNNPMSGVGQLIQNNGTTSAQNGSIQFFDVERPCLSDVMDYTSFNPSATPVNCCPATASLANSVALATQPANTKGFYIDLGNMVMAPGDEWIFEFDAVVASNAQVGDTACNSFLFRAIQDGTNVVLGLGESNDACITIEAGDDDDENGGNDCNCDICEDLTIEELHTEITNENRDCESYQLVTSYLGISSSTVFTTIRASVISYDLSANYTDCIKCIKKPFMWASLYGQELQGITPSVPIGNNLTSPYIVPNHPYTNIREVIWENPDGFNLAQIDKLPIEIYLPPVTELPCCEIYAKICIRLTFITENCQVCEEIVCIDASSLKRKNKKAKEKALAKSKHEDCGCKDKKHTHKSTVTGTDDCGCKGKKQKKAKKKSDKRKNLKA